MKLNTTTQLLDESPQWYAVHTRSNYEKRITADLAEAGLENYCPFIEQSSRRKDRKQTIHLPLFPGYLFVRISPSPELRRKVSFILGVVRILGSGTSIEAVPDEQVEAIRTLLATTRNCSACPLIREGTSIRVVHGPLRGLEGILTRYKNLTRIAVAIPMLSQSVTADVNIADVETLKDEQRVTTSRLDVPAAKRDSGFYREVRTGICT
jgi:transcription antitermination factor NusG